MEEGGSFNITSSSGCRQSIFYIALHCTHPNWNILKELKYILIHNSALQSFVWSSIALKIHVSHFENWTYLFMVSLHKWLAHFLLHKRWRNEGFQGTSDICHSTNGGSHEITHVFHLNTVKPLISNTSEFIKCRLFFNEFYTILGKFHYLRK